MAFQLKSPAFKDTHHIPRQFTGDGLDVSPPLEWKDVPPGTKELALICEDPDAPMDEPFVHWVACKIPAQSHSLPEAVPNAPEVNKPTHVVQGVNSFRKVGYGGPLPPKGHGRHRYFFKLYALDTELPVGSISGEVDKSRLSELIRGHVIAETELMGTYERL